MRGEGEGERETFIQILISVCEPAVLHSTVLFCTVLYCCALYCTAVYSTILHISPPVCNIDYSPFPPQHARSEGSSTGGKALESALSELHDDIIEHCPLLLPVFRRVCTEIHCERTGQKSSDLRVESPVKRHVLEIEQYGKGQESVTLKGRKSVYTPSTYTQASVQYVRKGPTYLNNTTSSSAGAGAGKGFLHDPPSSSSGSGSGSGSRFDSNVKSSGDDDVNTTATSNKISNNNNNNINTSNNMNINNKNNNNSNHNIHNNNNNNRSHNNTHNNTNTNTNTNSTTNNGTNNSFNNSRNESSLTFRKGSKLFNQEWQT
jgi:hypothetical protein